MEGRKIIPVGWKRDSGINDIIENYAGTCFEARKVAEGAKLFREMIESGDVIWLGVAGAGPACGMGGYITDLVENGFVDVICSTGAQVYHDGHFAYGFPVVQGSPDVDDNELEREGITRIYDTFISVEETLKAQDESFRNFIKGCAEKLSLRYSSADFNHWWGEHMRQTSPYSELSWVAKAAEHAVPIFWDSELNHSIGMNIAALYLESPSASLGLLEGAAIAYCNPQMGFVELGGGGPKNWIQQISPMLSQIMGIDFEGAERGLQITTAIEKDGGLSGCTFKEGVTWGKYKDAKKGLVQIWGDYSIIFPLIVGYVVETCQPRQHRRLYEKKGEFCDRLRKVHMGESDR